MTDAELNQVDWNKLRKEQTKLKDQQFIIGGDLPTEPESRRAAASCGLRVLDEISKVINSPETEIAGFLEKAIRKSNNTVGHLLESDQFTMNGKIMTVGLIQDICEEYRVEEFDAKEAKIRNMKFSNQDWKNFIDLCGTCDTVDTSNIISLWNIIKPESQSKTETKAPNPEGTHECCNFVEMSDWSRVTCSNYINRGDEHCSIHKAVLKNSEITNTSKSTFPILFGTKFF